jgi:hypothetical protein
MNEDKPNGGFMVLGIRLKELIIDEHTCRLCPDRKKMESGEVTCPRRKSPGGFKRQTVVLKLTKPRIIMGELHRQIKIS